MAQKFDGETYDAEADLDRLSGQLLKVFSLMRDGQWRTLEEISIQIGKPGSHASVSARLRDLRKPKFGCHEVERRPRFARASGLSNIG